MPHNQTNRISADECVTRGICSISPDLSYLQELIKEYIRELGFYLSKLKKIGISNNEIKEHIIEVISGLILQVNYDEKNLSKIISQLHSDLLQSKEMYLSIYKKHDFKIELIKSYIKKPKTLTLSALTRQGQNLFNTINEKTNPKQKMLYELLYNVIKSICIHLVELRELDIENEEAYELLLELISVRKTCYGCTEKIQALIDKSAKFDHSLLLTLQETRESRYGSIIPTEVSLSTRPNKAILVSGTNLRELEKLLEATKGKNIDIYTHGHMIMAHTFPKFQKYSHLVGHFGKGIETYLLDFAAFPGVIFLTRHSSYRLEALYRSRIYTTDVLAPKGVILIKNNNFEPLIESALSAKGFTHEHERPPIKINLDEKKALEEIKQVALKIEKREIKHFLGIGVSNHTKAQQEYFEKLANLLDEDCFVLSFSYTNNKDNILLIETDYGFPLVYKSLEILTEKISMKELDPIFCYTRCENHTISNVLYMKSIGIKHIYFTNCPPTMVNPALIESMREIYGIKKYTTPEADLKEMLAN